MLCKWDLAQMLAGSLGMKFFNIQLMQKIHSLSLPRLASLELSRLGYFYMTVVSWVSGWLGLFLHSSFCSRCYSHNHHSPALSAESPNQDANNPGAWPAPYTSGILRQYWGVGWVSLKNYIYAIQPLPASIPGQMPSGCASSMDAHPFLLFFLEGTNAPKSARPGLLTPTLSQTLSQHVKQSQLTGRWERVGTGG